MPAWKCKTKVYLYHPDIIEKKLEDNKDENLCPCPPPPSTSIRSLRLQQRLGLPLNGRVTCRFCKRI